MLARLAVLGVVASLALIRPAQADVPVDLDLVLAVDVSLSMAEDEAKLQRHGYSAALRDPRIIESIRGGTLGRIAVTYIEWSAVTDQRIVVGWRVISDAASAEAFAAELDKAPLKSGTTTSISAGLDFAVQQIQQSPYTAARRVIDVSGDGYNDYGRPIRVARDAAVAAGMVINGLPVMNKRPAWQESAPPDLDKYYAENVIGGGGSFSLVVKDIHDFGSSVLRKLMLEIAGLRERTPGPG
ncbi:MAG: hypothetical protein JWM91_4975 [Rhodospirillales bacterium]|nr:hypothetical protein [Rhodospirillales bacterium]